MEKHREAPRAQAVAAAHGVCVHQKGPGSLYGLLVYDRPYTYSIDTPLLVDLGILESAQACAIEVTVDGPRAGQTRPGPTSSESLLAGRPGGVHVSCVWAVST